MTTHDDFLRRWHSLPEHLKQTQCFDARKALIRYCQGFIERTVAIQTAEMALEVENLKTRKN